MDRYAAALSAKFSPECMCLQDVSDGHTRQGFADGRALDAEGLEILLLLVSSAFEDLAALQRQQAPSCLSLCHLWRAALSRWTLRPLSPPGHPHPPKQAVNDILGPDLRSGKIHSIQMRCWTPAQWQKKGRPTTLRSGVPCALIALSESPLLSLPAASPAAGLAGPPVCSLPPSKVSSEPSLPTWKLPPKMVEHQQLCECGGGAVS
ncbi:hypothetical protein EMIHUDRAFT_440839 [Emiliania huxleyi CCMP1516]|uniref:F-box domain-containing protein n=2 Tax=Emiliania huxleyi TaxID=2903 RepID=A0A0D3KJ99_EMIH1|nr:hypothetical protein EMIHUDRAFT_440839 [Emiliania huxleyi CCMP1516]EOD35834.1 hypothetical protein EMIHUDRAFT_440839 [Emiliania huxleyi CCMP1516]|eukprot:XP_005788263.1 hypothetical protein EMIHUDRAFT_440839 [Emiliania huxleyi CCMP1516]